MDSDDEEMRDASSPSSSGCGGGDDGAFEAVGRGADEGVMVMEVRWFEVDLDYEFDAPRWFDLAQEETPVEAAAAQLWFSTAPSYPPSPLIAMLLAEDLGLQSLRSIADINAVHCSESLQECSGGAEQSIHRPHVPNEGRIPCYGLSENERKPGTRTIVKGNFSKGSTLLKPTASQLARQSRQLEVKNAMKSKKVVGVRSERSTMSSNDCTHQAAKRQRLESGHLNKVVATNKLELIHKTNEKNVVNSSSDRATGLPKLKITIPREPELVTKLRAERSRILRAVPTNSKQLNKWNSQSASTTQAPSTRKLNQYAALEQALPHFGGELLNLHHVVQPFQATYHQHTNVQHANVSSNMPVCTSNCASNRHNVDKKPEDCRDGLFKFKARPVDKKILASKGDIGVFQCAKRNTTVPKEFNLSTSRKGKHAPLAELFNKLSLTAEAHCGIDHQARERPNYITTKDCKENMIGNIRC